MTSDRENKLLNAEEKDFVDRLAIHYAPTPMTPAQRIAFDRALEERINRRAPVSFLRPVPVVATVCAALLILLTVPYLPTPSPNGMTQPGTVGPAREGATSPEGEATLLAYAYYSEEFYGEESEGEEDFLPDEYEALALAFALSGA